MRVVVHSQILRVHAAAVAAGLSAKRGALFAGVPRDLVAGLSDAPSPDAQLLTDLDHLNDYGRLPDGSVPLQTWLANALALCGLRTEAEVFREALALARVDSQEIISLPSGEAGQHGAATQSRAQPVLASVHLSYGDDDLPFARRLHEALEAAGVPVFFRHEHAVPGAKRSRSARRSIREYEYVILLCSEPSLRAPSVVSELDEMLSREFDDGASERIIPILLDDYVYQGWQPRHPDIRRAVLDRVPLDLKGAAGDRAKFDKALKRLLGALKG